MRAANSQATESACQKSTVEAISSTSASSTTSRRPRWSEKVPNSSAVPSNAKA
ncbi:hypothetical protein D3C71_1991400 [compost metagenome]